MKWIVWFCRRTAKKERNHCSSVIMYWISHMNHHNTTVGCQYKLFHWRENAFTVRPCTVIQSSYAVFLSHNIFVISRYRNYYYWIDTAEHCGLRDGFIENSEKKKKINLTSITVINRNVVFEIIVTDDCSNSRSVVDNVYNAQYYCILFTYFRFGFLLIYQFPARAHYDTHNRIVLNAALTWPLRKKTSMFVSHAPTRRYVDAWPGEGA